MGLQDHASQRAAEALAKQSKQIELKLLNSRRRLEEKKRTNLQLVDLSAKTGVVPSKLKDDTRKKSQEKGLSGSRVLKPQSHPCHHAKIPSKKSSSSTPAPTLTVPACVTLTPEQASATVESSVTNLESKRDLDKGNDESSTGGIVPGTPQAKEKDDSDDDSTITSMSEITAPGSTITVEQHKAIVKLGFDQHDKLKAQELQQKDVEISKLKSLIESLKAELTKATEGKETSADPLLKIALEEAQKALQVALRDKKTSDNAYATLQKREAKKKEDMKKLKMQLKELQEAAKANEGSSGNLQDENAVKEIATLQDTVKSLKKQLDVATKELDKVGCNRDVSKDQSEIARLKSELQTSKRALTKSKNDLSSVKAKLKKAEADLKKALASDSSARSARSQRTLPTNNQALKDQIAALKQALKDAAETNKGLAKRNEILGKKLEEAYKELKKQGKSAQSEIKAQVNKAARDYVKDVVFRTTKLVSSKKPSEVTKFMSKVYDGIKDELGLVDKKSDDYLDFDDFHRIYQGKLLGYMSTQRSNVQQACLKAVVEWYKEHEYVPELEDITQVYAVLQRKMPAKPTDTSSEEDKEAYDDYIRDMDLLLWYLDKYLPAAVGELSFGKAHRYYKKQTDSVDIRGKRRILVERQSEAYGWLMYENCYDKWCHVVPQQAKDPTWKVPDWKKDDPATHPYHDTKYSDPRGGQKAGWKASARTALNGYCEAIKELREQDKKKAKKGSSIYQKCLDLLRKEHGITEDEVLPKSRKRKRSKKATIEDEEDFMDVDDESEAPFSIHSEEPGEESDDEDQED